MDEWVNKLAKYRKDTGTTWRVMEDLTGLSVPSLVKICAYENRENMAKIKLSTYELIKAKLNIDLLN